VAVVIDIADVTDGWTSPVSDADLTAFIAAVDKSDACLDAGGVPDALASTLKVLGVRHLATLSATAGQVLSERSASGAARTYADVGARDGTTSHLRTLKAIDTRGCVLATLSNNQRVQLRAAGRRSAHT